MTHDDYGWIAVDRARRFWDEHPADKIENWHSFAEDHGMEVVWQRLPYGLRGMRIGRIIILHTGLSEPDAQTVIRHEMCHYFLHTCNMLCLQDRWDGEMMLSKYERQARELARLLGSR